MPNSAEIAATRARVALDATEYVARPGQRRSAVIGSRLPVRRVLGQDSGVSLSLDGSQTMWGYVGAAVGAKAGNPTAG